jgi:VWFA-related protein
MAATTCENGGNRSGLTRALSWLVLLCAAYAACAQSVPGDGSAGPQLIPRTKAERETQYAAHHRILLNVQVTDALGHPVLGLHSQDFELHINHQPQKIASFQAVQHGGVTAHAHAFFVVDLLNNSARDLAKSREAIAKLADSGKPLPMPVSLVIISEKGMEISRESRNAEELAANLEQAARNVHFKDCAEDWNNAALDKDIPITSPDYGAVRDREGSVADTSNCLNEKFKLSFTALLKLAHDQQDVPGRAILIWIGPGWPVLFGPHIAPDTPHMRQLYFSNLVEVSTELLEGQVTLDAVSWQASSSIAKLNPSDWETLMRGTPNVVQASARSVAMQVLAHASGGQVYMDKRNLKKELDRCLADADSYYVLGFDSIPSGLADEFRVIDIKVDKPGVLIRANTDYYAQP